MGAIYKDAQREGSFTRKKKILTFQYNRSVVSKHIWLELYVNLSHPYFEKRSPDCQSSIRAGSNITVQNQSVSERMTIRRLDGRVERPTKKIAFLKFVGPVFDTGFILEYDLEDGRRAYLDKFDKYFSKSICSLL